VEGLLFRVHQLVSQQAGTLLEDLLALHALIGFGLGVDDLVPE
jgi:hypothetical protein